MLVPRPPSSLDTGWDKMNHVLAFAGPALAGLLGRAGRGVRSAVLLLAGLLAWGGVLELLQTLVPPRQGDVADLVADAIGLAIGALIYRLLRGWLRPTAR